MSAGDPSPIEDSVPWLRPSFQADLALLSASTAAAARAYAADVRVLARLVAQVPRRPMDESGASAWTSFRREVAVARSISDRAAGRLIREAVRLTGVLVHTMDLLEAGRITVARAQAFVAELEIYDDELAAQIDADLADRAARLPAWRIAVVVRRAALILDGEAAALRTAAATASREVSFQADPDEQASALLRGPAVPLTRWYATIDAQARALKAAGDPRSLDNLRFDLATSTFPCDSHAPADPTQPDSEPAEPDIEPAEPERSEPEPTQPADGTVPADETAGDETVPGDLAVVAGQAGLRPSGVEPAPVDCRRGRPVQTSILVPVETALGLSSEPGWLDGYGWVGAPTARQLLVDAELRRVCAHARTGELIDLAERDVRPPPTPHGVREALLDMVLGETVLGETVLGELTMSDIAFRVETQHDPSPPLRQFVTLRDRTCDGPTGSRISAVRCDLDHDERYPDGPTAAWNLVARGERTHQLKHFGWTPLRTPASTVWISPAGQSVEVPRHHHPPPGIDSDPHGIPAALPDPAALAALDRAQLQAPTDDDHPPWLPATELR